MFKKGDYIKIKEGISPIQFENPLCIIAIEDDNGKISYITDYSFDENVGSVRLSNRHRVSPSGYSVVKGGGVSENFDYNLILEECYVELDISYIRNNKLERILDV